MRGSSDSPGSGQRHRLNRPPLPLTERFRLERLAYFRQPAAKRHHGSGWKCGIRRAQGRPRSRPEEVVVPGVSAVVLTLGRAYPRLALVTSPVRASVDSVVLTVGRRSPVTVATSPAVMDASRSLSACRTAPWLRPGAEQHGRRQFSPRVRLTAGSLGDVPAHSARVRAWMYWTRGYRALGGLPSACRPRRGSTRAVSVCRCADDRSR